MTEWAKIKTIQREVAEMPIGWLYQFAATHPQDVRKVSSSRNSPILLRSKGVLAAVEVGWGCEIGGADAPGDAAADADE